ncbi:unnamed protein product, partial [Ectocarpus sp. 4 AP-2014]
LVAVLASAPSAHAQVTWQIGAINDNWSVDDNWDTFAVPFASFDSEAIIGAPQFVGGNPSGWNPNANVRAIGAVTNAPTVRIANGSETTGVLTIEAGNSLDVVATQTGSGIIISSGDVLVGQDGGTGTLDVAGTLSIASSLQAPT